MGAIFSKSSMVNKTFMLGGEDLNDYDHLLPLSSEIKADMGTQERRCTVMSSKVTLSYLTDTIFVRLPSNKDLKKVLDFAVSRNVDYVVIDKNTLKKMKKKEGQPDHAKARIMPFQTPDYGVFKILK